jgi:hypothetical protein
VENITHKNERPIFFLISGAAASGKTTVARSIATRLDNIACHDYDEKGPTDFISRCRQLEDWIQLALDHQASGRDFLLTSHSPLGELLACPSAIKLNGIAACLLDCSDPVRVTRMRQRGIDPRWPPTQDTLNWAAWHRMHAWDPQWEQHVIVDHGPPHHVYERWTGWAQSDARWRVTTIDTTILNQGQVLDRVAAWVQAEKATKSLLSAETRWWKNVSFPDQIGLRLVR